MVDLSRRQPKTWGCHSPGLGYARGSYVDCLSLNFFNTADIASTCSEVPVCEIVLWLSAKNRARGSRAQAYKVA